MPIKVSRRRLLSGIGAAAFILEPFARQRIAFSAPKGNFLFIGSHNGFVRSAFGANGSGNSMTLLPSLSPFEAVKSDLVVIRGLCNKSSSTFNSLARDC